MTRNEERAIALYAEVVGTDVSEWAPARHLRPGVWYAYADPTTGLTGTCRIGHDHRWIRPPRGVEPVVLRTETDA